MGHTSEGKAARREKAEALVTCLSCGQTSPAFVFKNSDGNGLAATARCPKCSNRAYTNNLHGLWAFMQAAAHEIARIKLDMIDLQDDGEER